MNDVSGEKQNKFCVTFFFFTFIKKTDTEEEEIMKMKNAKMLFLMRERGNTFN